MNFFSLFFCTDQQTEVKEEATSEDKVAKHVTFSEEGGDKSENKAETIRNFYMMEKPKEEGKPNFLVGGEDGFEDVEEKDLFPSNMSNGMSQLTKQLSDAALLEKRRRLR
jgi:hypothetical protein